VASIRAAAAETAVDAEANSSLPDKLALSEGLRQWLIAGGGFVHPNIAVGYTPGVGVNK